MEIAKALILAGCEGPERPWRSAMGPGPLFPVANRPLLFHNLHALRAAGVLEAAILAEGASGETIRAAVGDGTDWDLRLRHVEWRASAGVGGALAAGREFLAGEPVLVQQGDALLDERMHAHISAFAYERLDALALRLAGPPGRARRAGMTPGYLLSPRAISILLATSDGAANPVTSVRAGGGRVRIQRVDGCLPFADDQEMLLEGNRRALDRLETAYAPESLEESSIQGPVEIHPTAHVSRSLIRGPAIIGPGARIRDAYVGPYTSIAGGVVLEGAEIEHSIVLENAELRFVGTRLESSIIGRGARIGRGFRLPSAIRVSLGEGAELILP
jgi:glucose-1-phosphate thymidylyltransferase